VGDATVSVVIVNWNGRRLLGACLDALLRQTRPADEIVLVDNGSTDGSTAFVAARYPRVTILPLARNVGFAAGNNHGIARSRGALIATLNNDTVPAATWLEELCAPLEADPALGSAMSTMLFAGAPERIAAAGLRVCRNGLALDDLAGHRYTGRRTTPRPIFGPSAGAALYRRRMLNEIGAFDRDFFMYLEDVDLAWRARLRGWDSVHAPAATTLHLYSASSVQGSAFKRFHLARNRLWCLRKNLPAPLARRHAAAIAAYDAAAVAYALLTRDGAGLRGRLAGIRDRAIARKRREIQRSRTASDEALERWLEPSPSPLEVLALRRRVDRLASAPPALR
jgi:GT2 family glycosyltransferase